MLPRYDRDRKPQALCSDGIPPMRTWRRSSRDGASGSLRALMFDVDGTLADTEREGHLAACNAAFAERGLPIRWSWDEYRELLRIPGNKNRMRLALTQLGTLSATEVDALAEDLFRLKQAR